MIDTDATALTGLPRPRAGARLSDADFLVFAIPFGLCFEIHAIGEVFPADILVTITFALLLVSDRIRIPDRSARIVIALFLLWFEGQAITDFVLRTPIDNIARGWAMIILSAVSFVTIYTLIGDSSRRLILFAAGMACGVVVRYFVDPGLFASGYPWKFGYGFAVTLAIVLAAVATHRSPLVASAIVMLAGATNLVEGYRSMALICIATAAIIVGQQARRLFPRVGSTMLVLILAAGSLGLAYTYDSLAASGALGFKAQEKFDLQSSGALGVILGGRGDIVAAFLAIRDSPILGHGSWATDPNLKYTLSADALLLSLGYHVFPPAPQDEPLLPSHSHLLGAWANAGILGAVFWLWVAWLAARSIAATWRSDDACAVLFAFLACSLLWDLFFSPYGAERRIVTPYYIVAAIMILRRSDAWRTDTD
jgi:hypothetical protein